MEARIDVELDPLQPVLVADCAGLVLIEEIEQTISDHVPLGWISSMALFSSLKYSKTIP